MVYASAIILATLTTLWAIPSTAVAADRQLLRIGTGGDGGTYLPVGSLIAQALTHSLPRHESSHPHQPLLAVAQRSTGSEANITDLRNGLLEAGLAQADVVHWTYNAAGPYADLPTQRSLRTVASLYLESVHLIAHRNSDINQITDLIQQRVSVDEQGSGTRLNIPYLLNAHGIRTSQMQTVFLKPVDAIDRLRRGQLDAFFVVAGYPVEGIAELIEDDIASVIPIDGTSVSQLLEHYPFFTEN